MKKFILLLSFIALFCQSAFAQTGGLNFQGVARNSTGAVLANQKINLKFSILKTTETGAVEYTETKEVTTNAQGIFAVVVGEVNVTDFAAVDWKVLPKFLKVEMDPAGGTSFVAMGTTRLQNVPYAYYANGVNANNIDGTISVAKGGTGATDVAAARTNLGLGNVDNTSDAAKPISSLTKAALDLKANAAEVNSALVLKANAADVDSKAPLASPTFTGMVSGVTKSMVGLGSVDNTSDAAKPVSTATQTALDLKATIASPTFTGTVSGITKNMVGLGLVDNTTDAAKPISIATQAALDLKASTGDLNNALALKANVTALNLKAPLASPTFTGTVTGITKNMVGLGLVDNTTDAAKPISTATQTALDLKVSTSDLNTALAQKANVSELNLKAPIASPTFTGNVEAAGFKIANGASTQYLMADGTVSSGGGSIIPNLANSVTGTLPVANGGTGLTSVGTSGQVLTTSGSGTLTWTTSSGVPYTGAIQAVDLGAYDLKVNGLTVGLGGGSLTSNSASGYRALSANTTGYSNTASGASALYRNTTGAGNTANGDNALSANTTGYGNTASGATALLYNTIGVANTASGARALYFNTTGNENTADGHYALFRNSVGTGNTASGNNSLYSNTTGDANTASGAVTLYSNTTGNRNTTSGYNSLSNNTTGSDNVASGVDALKSNTIGNNNTVIGRGALLNNITGSNNTAIGYLANVGSGNLTNATAIGNQALVVSSNTIQLGNTDVTNVKTSGTITAGDVTYPNAHGTFGQVLSTTGSGTLTWTTASGGSSLPSQTGNFGKFLSSDGMNAAWSNITLPTASSMTLGGIKVGTGLSMDMMTGALKVNTGSGLTTDMMTGAIKVNTGSNFTTDMMTGALKVNTGSGLTTDMMTGALSLNTASSMTLGGIKVGAGFSMDMMNSGTMNLNTASSTTLGGIKVGSGLSMDMMTGALKVNTGSGLTTDMMMGTLKVNTGSGLTTDMMTGAIKVNTGSNFTTDMMTGALKVNTGSGLMTDMMTGALKVNTGSGLTTDMMMGTLRVNIGSGLTTDMMNGAIKVNMGSGLTTDMMTGAIKVNTGSNFTTDMMTGALKVNTGSGLTSDMMTGALSLNTASSMTLGGVKVGAGLNIDMDGVLSTSSAAPSGKKYITTVVGPINTSNYSSGDIVYDQSSGNFYLFKSSIPNQNSVGFNNANTSFGSFVSGGRPVVIKIRPSVSGFITSISLDVGNATDAVFSLYSGLEVCSSVATVNASTLMGTSSANSGTGIINFTFPTPIAVNAYSDYYLTVSSSDSSVAYIRVRTGGSDSNFAISYGGCDINQGSPGVQITYGPYITL